MESAFPNVDGTDILAVPAALQGLHEEATSSEDRRGRGQVFTPSVVARFMASLVTSKAKDLRVLDPGAGAGVLAAAVCERVARSRSPRSVELHLYETDPGLIKPLQKVMGSCRVALENRGHSSTSTIHETDFIEANASVADSAPLFPGKPTGPEFDVVIMNPPYFKVAGDSRHAQLLRAVVHGQPNIYALYMAVGAELLRHDGELIAITPRSFCNGLYFKGFRRFFFERMSLRRAHLFGSRKDTFREAGVLQESLITRCTRMGRKAKSVRVSTTVGRDGLDDPPCIDVPSGRILDDRHGDMVLRLPAQALEAEIMNLVEDWPQYSPSVDFESLQDL